MSFTVRARGLAIGVLLAMSCLVAWSVPADAHRDGCHRWHSCPSDTGSYVCGDTGHFSECGYTSLPEEPVTDYDAPRRPALFKSTSRPHGQVAVTVSAERGAKLVVKSGRKTVFKTKATGGRQTLTFKGLNGVRGYSVRATDPSGNTSSVAKFKATADALAPSLKGATIVAGTPENAFTRLTFSPGEAARYVVTVDGKRVAAGRTSGDAKEIGFPVDNGRHRFVVKLTDAAGNVSALKRRVVVKAPHLAPVLETLTEPNEVTQRFSLVGTPGSRGTLKIAGKVVPVRFEGETTEISVDLPDGRYQGGTLNVHDQLGRTGKVVVPAFTIDTAAPTLEAVRTDRRSTTGRLVARVTAEAGAQVVWRVLDEGGQVVEKAKYVATGKPRTVDVNVEEGTAKLEVEASDEAGNGTTDGFTAEIEADPLTATGWVVILILLGLLFGIGALVWRRRDRIKVWGARQRHGWQVRRARVAHHAALQRHSADLKEYAKAVSDHQRRLAGWTARRQDLANLHDEALSAHGIESAGSEILGVKAKTGERLFSIVGGRLLEERSRDNVPTLVEVEHGQVAVTNLRVLFRGRSKRREWAYDKVESITEVGLDATLLKVSNRKSLSGVGYDDPERTRLHLSVALNPGAVDRQQLADMISTVLRDHEAALPAAPAAAPRAPHPPAILLQEAEDIGAPAH